MVLAGFQPPPNLQRLMTMNNRHCYSTATDNFSLSASILPPATLIDSSPPLQASELAEISSLSNEVNIAVFLVGLIPFVWASYEFWRRIAFGESFGTGSDSVVIGKDGDKVNSRGRRRLGTGALNVAYLLFAIGGFTLLVSIISVLPQSE